MSNPSPRYIQGMKTRRKVLGEKYVDAAVTNTSPFTEDFQELITETAWGNVWSRNTIPLRERSMLTIALLAALGHYDEVAMHVRATRNTGASLEDIKEALLHVAIYAGVPAANHAFKIAAKAYAEIEAAEKEEDHA
ncbi:4-carboxymuconolactone decarboxylase [Acidocella aminolytica]|uniref:4-carboxymuconolactone decarboxylase n=1 Tax=Acidocella aminolytica 101 = DSM 11237 TaxID=1120923 RepID=A0A0D6PED6_9PROT|nr:4-carboxymuconolactone decarboxylase [Acidocella aminolytica]GAN79578.1 4-carboxymuconolactone decarboxylase [Acidocella aminolytica 101 = DSM 11237]GBQ39096.1 4-carboxymuconolactone decarboxylase [Acidocella aminolytica 101 = DSM 11237]SHF27751.1 4-carboxymuconolactone decarboxylase [Acidocella aminolytica 101 = DSM 11237]